MAAEQECDVRIVNPRPSVRPSYENLPSAAIAIEGFVSAKLVAVPTADRGASNALRCVVLIIEAACLPGAEHSSDKFR
jgi:hypothetical protein